MLGAFVHADITQFSRRRENSLVGVWTQQAGANSVSAPPVRPAAIKCVHREKPGRRVLTVVTVLRALEGCAAADDRQHAKQALGQCFFS